jgi:hypothetical protein
MQATETTGKLCPPSADSTALKPILNGIAQDLGYTPTTLPSTLSTDQAANVLHVTPETLALWRSKGKPAIPYQKTGRFVRYPVQAIALFILDRTYTTANQPMMQGGTA